MKLNDPVPNNDESIGELRARLVALEDQNRHQQAQLDELRDLRSKGQGAFWFVSIVFGLVIAIGFSKLTSILSAIGKAIASDGK